MPLVHRFVDFMHDLQQLERAALGAQGPLILEAFTRHTEFDTGAVWLREPRGAAMRLAAAKIGLPTKLITRKHAE